MSRPIKTFAQLVRSVRDPKARRGLNKMRNDRAFRRRVLEELANRLEAKGRKAEAKSIRDRLAEIDWKQVFDLIIKYLPMVLSILMMFI